jgi:hypothetical protein
VARRFDDIHQLQWRHAKLRQLHHDGQLSHHHLTVQTSKGEKNVDLLEKLTILNWLIVALL